MIFTVCLILIHFIILGLEQNSRRFGDAAFSNSFFKEMFFVEIET